MSSLCKVGLTSVMSLVLVACGSGGGGSGTTAPTTTTPAATAAPTTTTPTTAPTPAPVVVDKNYYVQTGGNPEKSLSFDPNAIAKITIGGQTLDLSTVSTMINGRWHMQSGSNLDYNGFTAQSMNIYTASPNMVVGLISKDNVSYAFFNGKPTDVAQMPKGTATYLGDATMRVVQDTSVSTSIGNGNATFNIDFDNRKFAGTINRDVKYGGPLALAADITGNSFKSAAGASVETKGQFFGDNAGELGGIFQDKTTMGAFFGKKQ